MDDFAQKLEQLKEVLANTKRGVLFSGAGISVPSGIPDFRSSNGLYSTKYGDFSAEYMLSHTFFINHYREFYEFYKEKMLYPKAKPNCAHIFFAELEKQGVLAATVTQNIDGLHTASGAKNVLELHGSVYRNRCMQCGKSFELDYILSSNCEPHCDKCGGRIKPEVVLYEEQLDQNTIKTAVKFIQAADTLIVVGTSLAVYPAAGLIDYFNGDNLVLLNKGATQKDRLATLAINADIAQIITSL